MIRSMKPAALVRIVGIVLLSAIVAAVLIFLPVRAYLESFLEWVRGMGLWGPVLLGAVYVVACVLFVPGFILTVGAGFLFGPLVGTITVSVASVLGASAAFLLARTLARGWVQRKVADNPKFRALDEAVRQQGFKIVLLTRLSPILPFNLLNFAFGLTNISLRDFVIASWIGMLPATIVYTYLGSTLKDLADVATGQAEWGTAREVLFGVGLVAAVAVMILITRIARRALQQAVPVSSNDPEIRQQGEVHA
jgi:uncharacterized membrane protein YdjX (TVP38/TMEM64 family)